ncbi:unnamed protein product [Fraxinus pennsylvanica]|uniref:Photosynthetic NDH subcomplex B 4 n=1 Tax=Fraxinus pennsylvanica TaxID=56036 RepID=A0AAD1ZD81_9LAMI|nr:unnamed protein product [Fraxinus pennsylvanica]
MAETVMSFSVFKPHVQTTKLEFNSFSRTLRQCPSSRFDCGSRHLKIYERCSTVKVNAIPDWPLMAVLVEHMEGQRDLVTHKSIWHLSDEAMKNVYTLYVMFTCWGCCFFGSTKDPYYDSETYRKDGGDGTGHWVYEKQEDIEESGREELLREELIEEIEKKVGGLRELEEAGKKEELVK